LNCIDSDLVIESLRGAKEADAVIRMLEEEGDVHITAISVFEVTYTTKGLSRKKEMVLRSFLDTLKVLPLDEIAARKAGVIGTKLARNGEMVHPMDLLIASICLKEDARFFTGNLKHYSRIPGLQAIDWRRLD